MKTLREHCGWLDCFQGDLKPISDDLNRLYADLSAAVHSTSSKTLVLRQALDDIRLSMEQTNAVKKDLHAVLKACLALCMFSEFQTYLGLHANVHEFFSSVLSVREKSRLEKALVASGLVEIELPAEADGGGAPAEVAPPISSDAPVEVMQPDEAVGSIQTKTPIDAELPLPTDDGPRPPAQ
ncbi:hypothetical protein [Ralstonia pseudosolanacearum]